MIRTVSQIKDELADREAIRDCLYRYSRGADRCDEEMIRSAYWPDAIDDHMAFSGTREELIAWMMPIMKGGMDQTQHLIANVLIQLHGAAANVESYFYGFHRIRGEDGKPRDTIGAGRYLDRFERRDDEWRIAKRTVITDWFRDYPDSADWEAGPFGMQVPPGGRHPDDPSYAFFAAR
ncbi:nuclear transport factor 2 family protein [Phenylobacterium sp. LjRoot219]|uniref:nuclear transport factor 2 family protein n=1 Tax=Phenylobacterium sp. LjRoot219 TaxID=3342283 RepID=UPI003ECF587A